MKNDQLVELGKRLQLAVRTGANAPLILAKEVIDIAARWHEFGADTEGKTANEWLREHVSPTLGLWWWERRYEAVQALGEATRRKLHHEAAVWIHRSVAPQYHAKAIEVVMKATAEQGGALLTPAQVRSVVATVLPPKPPTPKLSYSGLLERIRELEEQLAIAEQRMLAMISEP